MESAEAGVDVSSLQGADALLAAWPDIGSVLQADVTVQTTTASAEITDTFMEGLYKVRDGLRSRPRVRPFAEDLAASTSGRPAAPSLADPAPSSTTSGPSLVARMLPHIVDVAVDVGPVALAYRTADSAVAVTVEAVTLAPGQPAVTPVPRPGSCGQICLDAAVSVATVSVAPPGEAPWARVVMAGWGRQDVLVTNVTVAVLDVAAQSPRGRNAMAHAKPARSPERASDRSLRSAVPCGRPPCGRRLGRSPILEVDRIAVRLLVPEAPAPDVAHPPVHLVLVRCRNYHRLTSCACPARGCAGDRRQAAPGNGTWGWALAASQSNGHPPLTTCWPTSVPSAAEPGPTSS